MNGDLPDSQQRGNAMVGTERSEPNRFLAHPFCGAHRELEQLGNLISRVSFCGELKAVYIAYGGAINCKQNPVQMYEGGSWDQELR